MRKAFDRLRDFPFNEQVSDAIRIFSIVTVMVCGMMLVYKTQSEHRRTMHPAVKIQATDR